MFIFITSISLLLYFSKWTWSMKVSCWHENACAVVYPSLSSCSARSRPVLIATQFGLAKKIQPMGSCMLTRTSSSIGCGVACNLSIVYHASALATWSRNYSGMVSSGPELLSSLYSTNSRDSRPSIIATICSKSIKLMVSPKRSTMW